MFDRRPVDTPPGPDYLAASLGVSRRRTPAGLTHHGRARARPHREATMEIHHVKTFEGSPEPSDIFQPHKLGVELLSDMDGLFAKAHRISASGEYAVGEGEVPAEVERMKGQRSVVIMTPGRMLMPVPAPAPGSVQRSSEDAVRKLLPPDPPRKVSVVSYTYVPALLEDKSRAIPFLGFLVGFASIGHTVVVFEGHPSAFESGIRGSDVLMVDSGMQPFMQEDWMEVAFRVMRPGAKVFVHIRETYTLRQFFPPGVTPIPLVLSPEEQLDWYVGSLIRLLLVGTRTSAQLTSGETLPDLADFATTPEQRAQIASLPFRHDQLDTDKVIDCILKTAKMGFFSRTGTVRIPMQTDEGMRLGACGVELSRGPGGRRQLLLER
jgi:hypothetical protein